MNHRQEIGRTKCRTHYLSDPFLYTDVEDAKMELKKAKEQKTNEDIGDEKWI